MPLKAEYPPPQWWSRIREMTNAGVSRTYILSGDVSGQSEPMRSLQQYLTAVFKEWDVVVFYDRAAGIQFAHPSMKATYLKLVGRDKPAATDAAQGAAQSMLARALGNQAPSSGDSQMPEGVTPSIVELGTLLRNTVRKPGYSEDDTDPNHLYKVAVVLLAAETIIPDAPPAGMSPEDRTNLVNLRKWANDDTVMTLHRLAFLVTDTLTDLHSSLRAAGSRWESIAIPKPNEEQRRAYIEMLLQSGTVPFEWDTGVDLQRLVNATAGLGLNHIQDILLRAKRNGTLTQELVQERKAAIIKAEFGDVLEYYDPEFGFPKVAGYDHVKLLLQRTVIAPLRTGQATRCPMGVLFIGAPGTGKTVMAKALAYEAGVNFLILNLAKIKGMYVGSSERNLEKALGAIEEQGGIVFIDELDQAFQRGESGDSGVSMSLFKRILEFISDKKHKGRIVFAAATNRPDLIDPALKRPGRFDKLVPFMRPDPEERLAIFQLHGKLTGFPLGTLTIDNPVIRLSEGWTASEIAQAVENAVGINEDEFESKGAALHCLQLAVESMAPDLRSHTYYENLALQACTDKRLLPPRYQARLNNREELEKETVAVTPRLRTSQDLL